MKRALILGVGGQDGSYLARILLERGYDVHGLYRRTSVDNLWRIRDLRDRIRLHRGDLLDGASIERVIVAVQPDAIYNMADQDHVSYSRETPQVSIDITAGAVQRLLETVVSLNPKIKVFQPVSATIFGKSEPPQHEGTPLNPMSPYACAKACALHFCRYYRRWGAAQVTCGIMFNHESEVRGPDYLIQRLIGQVKCLKRNRQGNPLDGSAKVRVANPNMIVDIGYAPEFMECVVDLMERDILPDDYCIGTGRRISVWGLAHAVLTAFGFKDPDLWIEICTDPKFAHEPTLIANALKLVNTIGRFPCINGQDLIQKLLDNQIILKETV